MIKQSMRRFNFKISDNSSLEITRFSTILEVKGEISRFLIKIAYEDIQTNFLVHFESIYAI